MTTKASLPFTLHPDFPRDRVPCQKDAGVERTVDRGHGRSVQEPQHALRVPVRPLCAVEELAAALEDDVVAPAQVQHLHRLGVKGSEAFVVIAPREIYRDISEIHIISPQIVP